MAKWEASQRRLNANAQARAALAALSQESTQMVDAGAKVDRRYAREWLAASGLFAPIALCVAVFILLDGLNVPAPFGNVLFAIVILTSLTARYLARRFDRPIDEPPPAWAAKLGLPASAVRALPDRIASGFLWAWLAAGIVMAAGSRYGYGTAISTQAFAALFLIYGIGMLVKDLLQRKHWRAPASIILYSGALLAMAAHNLTSIERTHESNFRPLIAALSAYKADTGSYPEQLEQLMPVHLSRIPDCPIRGESMRTLHYARREPALNLGARDGEDGYYVSCLIGVFVFPQRAEYESRFGHWEYTD